MLPWKCVFLKLFLTWDRPPFFSSLTSYRFFLAEGLEKVEGVTSNSRPRIEVSSPSSCWIGGYWRSKWSDAWMEWVENLILICIQVAIFIFQGKPRWCLEQISLKTIKRIKVGRFCVFSPKIGSGSGNSFKFFYL